MDFELLDKLTRDGLTIREMSKETGKSYTTIRYWLKKHSLVTRGTVRIGQDWSIDRISQLSTECGTINEVLKSLGLGDSSGEYKALRHYASAHNIALPEYRNNGSNVRRLAISDEDFFSEGVKRSGYGLRKRMIRLGTPYVCSCGQGPTWAGKELVLQVDHIDGNSYNNKRENLRFLCPNCHTQTETFCGRNRPATSKEED